MRLLTATLLAVTMPAASALNPGVALGIDLGTSGVRAAVVEKKTNGGVAVLEEASAAWSDAEGRRPEVWLSKLRETLRGCAQLSKVERVAVSGTSGSCLLVDADTGKVTRGPLMYNDAVEPSSLIDAAAPPGHCTRSGPRRSRSCCTGLPRARAKSLPPGRLRRRRAAGGKPVLVRTGTTP